MKLIFSRQLTSEQDLTALARDIQSHCPSGSIVLLSGDLSAGKTTFVVHFSLLWGLKLMQSPTYAIHQRYSNAQITIDHFDLYRLDSEEELESAGVYDLLNQPSDYKLIEWPERLNHEDLPLTDHLYGLSFKVDGDGQRRVDFFQI